MKLQDNALELFEGLPGEALVRKGLDDLAAGKETIESLLVFIGAPRLRLMKIPIPKSPNGDSDKRLYALLCVSHGRGAHSQYNSLLRQLGSFERALERRYAARDRQKEVGQL
jgi:hypothetical protein